jgi:hypothetical protein
MEQANPSKGFSQLSAPLRTLVFGKQNERLEYVMDSYFKLPPEGRSAVIFGSIVLSIVLLVAIVTGYVAALGSLQSRLDEAFEAMNKLKESHTAHSLTKQKFSDLEQKLEASTQGLVVISVLEQKAKELGLTTSGFPPQLPSTELVQGNPLAEKYQNAKVEFRVNNASLKKIMDYVIAIEGTQHMLRVSSLKIRSLYQNKLFFDATFEVEGIVAKR